MSKVFWTPPLQPNIDELGWFRLSIARIGDVHGKVVVISRTGYSGELGYEIFCHPKDATEIFENVFKGDAMMLQPESVGLLGAYWHYMLLVWGVLFAMLITT